MSCEIITRSGRIEIVPEGSVITTSGAVRDCQIGEEKWASVVPCEVIGEELPAIHVDPDGKETNRVQVKLGDLILAKE